MKHALRLVAAAAAGLLLTPLFAAPANAAPEDRAAGWTSRQLTDGLIVFPDFGMTEYGMTADAAQVLKAAGGHADDLDAIRAALAANVEDWTGDQALGEAGSTAKAIVLARTTGANPRNFGGLDLVSRLDGRVSMTEPTVGRLQDVVTGEVAWDKDYANTIGQAIAARGLARTGSDKADEVISYLLEQQCSEGYFRLYFTADKEAPEQHCDAGGAEAAAPDTDATALAVLNLLALPKAAKTRKVRTAIAGAIAWLKATQKENGSYGGGTATEGSNTNSTGLAARALGVFGACRAAERAATWVKRLQVTGDVSGTPLAGERGGIAYNRAAFRAAQEEGIVDDGDRYEWSKATVDAAGALRFVSCG